MTTDVEAEDTRTRIVDAALRCLESNEFQRVSMETIAQEANVGRATMYRHFANRDDVLAAVVLSETHRVLGELVPVARAEPDAGSAIVKLITLVVEVGPNEPTIAALVSRGNYLFTRDLLVDSADELFAMTAENVDALLAGREHELRPGVSREDVAEWVLRITISLLTVRAPRRRRNAELEDHLRRFLAPVLTTSPGSPPD